ncbi:MAG: transcription elongation factor NusA [Candidatus Nanohaloarchaea archaeon]
MKAPICNVCLKSDQLCKQCQEKLDEEQITEKEIEVSRILHDLSTEYGSLKDSSIEGVHDAEKVVVVITAEGDGAKVVGRNGEIVKELADRIDKSIRVVEAAEDDMEVIKGLLSPAEVKSVNTVFMPDGEYKKIVVDEDYEGKINLSEDEFEAIVERITGTEYKLAFE